MRYARRSKAAAFVVVPALLFAACSAGGDERTGSGGKDLRVAINLSDMASLDLARVSADAMLAVVPLFGQTLVGINQKDPTKLTPQLATSWKANADASSATFTIRKGVKFSTGNPMTAADVKFSLDRVKNIQGAPSDKLQAVKNISVLNPYSLRIDLQAPDSSFIASTATLFFAVMDSKTLKAHGGASDTNASRTDKAQTYLDTHTVGTGPYKLKSWQRNQQATFVPNPYYWGAKAKFKSITFLDIRDPSTQSQLIQKGDAQIALDIDPDTANSLQGDAGVKVVKTASYNMIYVGLNNASKANPQFADRRVRQAVQMAIDYNGISKGLALDAPRPPAVVPLGFQGTKGVQPVATNLQKAKALMAAAGYSRGFSVQVSFANVVQYGVQLTTLWEKLKSDLAKINITLSLKPTEYDSWIESYRAKQLPMTSSFYGPDFFDSSNFLDPFGRNEGNVAKRMAMNIPDGQSLFSRYLALTDTQQRDAEAAKLITAMRDDATFIPIVQTKKIIVYRDGLDNVAYSPNTNVTLLEVTSK